MSHSDKGFTLVELSIVLVIIGLLIGGILAAQSMISTTKIQAQIRQLQQFDVAVQNFKTKYNGIPGDALAFGGNGDGKLQAGVNYGDNNWQGEIVNFWANLSAVEGLQPNYTNNATAKSGITYPKEIIGNKVSVLVGVSDVSKPSPFWPNNYYFLGNMRELDGWLRTTAAITPQEGFAIDQKIDDGLANSGNVLAVNGGHGTVPDAGLSQVPFVDNTVGSGCVLNGDGSKYNLASTSQYPCNLAVLMLSQIGNTQ